MLFDLSHPRNMGLHDPGLAPMITGAAVARDSFVGGVPLVQNGRVPWLDLAELGAQASEHTAKLMEQRSTQIAG